MPSFAAIVAPLVLLLPFGAIGVAGNDGAIPDQVAEQSRSPERRAAGLPLSGDAPAWSPILQGIEPAASRQVRIERRVILRISPAPAGRARRNLMAESESPDLPRARVVERETGKCLDSDRIHGVSDRGDHLLMLMRDRSMIVARLEKGCSPRDYYRGFYVERSADGKLCVNRDRLMSRSGAKCQIARFSELVAERPD